MPLPPSVSRIVSDTWRLVETGNGRALAFTSLLGFDFEASADVPRSPLEEGSFVSYNKIVQPRDIRVELGCQGSPAELDSTLVVLDEWLEKATLLSFQTPSREYDRLALKHVSFRLSRETGIGALYVSLGLQEIREIGHTYQAGEGCFPITLGQAGHPQHASLVEAGYAAALSRAKSELPRALRVLLERF
ncbi:hypothetical protein IHV25_09980 [Phaeovibrio sulfidiphilus]|uniref:Dit-like phage tail protein N-terminal domain-containing protein n=1 Tax=Phaeovibrio sulfidiphilus TaxID=1220600 RepID=A0A8J7CDP7_9PROT|nr:hypothetical protein [Phaeovibrio sulfidiphilus]MBE1237968.1 hypothetical protein [Phaeovibrio sulfidiphilus]